MPEAQPFTHPAHNEDAVQNTQPAERSTEIRSGEDSVRRAAEAVINRSTAEGGSKQVRRRSRRARKTPILAGSGLQFHYGVGLLMLLTMVLVVFNNPIRKGVWRLLHPPAPPPVPGSHATVAGPAGPAPWWFHVEIPFLFIGFVIWLYLTPGIWDSLKSSLGLHKDKDRRSRRRHS